MTAKIGATSAAIQNLSVEVIPVFHWCATVNWERERWRKAKLAISEFSTIFLKAPEPEANVCFGRVKLPGWRELGLFWFTSATGLTQGLWHCPGWMGWELGSSFIPLQRAPDGRWGWRLHTLTEIEAVCHKAFYNSSLSLTEGNRQPFFLQ